MPGGVYDLAAFHYEDRFLKCADVGNRIALDGDEIGIDASLNAPNPIRPTQEVRRGHRCRPQN